MIASLWESGDKPRQCVEKWRHYSADKGLYNQGYDLFSGHVWLWELDHKEGRAPKNWCFWTVVRRRLLRVPWTARRWNQSILRVITLRAINLNIHWKDWCWSANILIIWCEQTIYWKSPWCWEGLRAEGEEDVRGWYDWVASPMQWTWTWANSWGKWWGTGSSGMLQSLGLQGVRHN